MNSKIDYLIVGQGLAGTCLAIELIKKGSHVLVIDLPSENHCSVVAAGLFNPITGKFLKRTWMAEKLFSSIDEFYIEAERMLGERFFFKTPIYRPFENIEEQNEWMTQTENPAIKHFINEIYNTPQWEQQVHNPFGGLLINQSGYVDVKSFLTSARKFLRELGAFKETRFDYEQVELVGSRVNYRNLDVDKVIFCEGTRIQFNPYFSWLPVRPMKGEVLEVEMTETPEVIFNRGAYLVPGKDGNYNVGSTYQQPPFREEATTLGREELQEKLNALLRIPYKVVDQKWGVRPTSPDRKPMLGAHPEFGNLIVLNGLGTKGVSLAPYFSRQLANWLAGSAEIVKEVNIQRFYPLYSGSSL